MIYRQTEGTNAYQVFSMDGQPVGSFSYQVETSPSGHERFWIDGIRLSDICCDYATMEAVLLFIRYKCERAGCPSMHIRVDQRNMLFTEMCLRFGFYMIDREEETLPHGRIRGVCVLKYTLPTSTEEIRHHHLLRTYKRK